MAEAGASRAASMQIPCSAPQIRRRLLALSSVSRNLPPDLTAWTWICGGQEQRTGG